MGSGKPPFVEDNCHPRGHAIHLHNGFRECRKSFLGAGAQDGFVQDVIWEGLAFALGTQA